MKKNILFGLILSLTAAYSELQAHKTVYVHHNNVEVVEHWHHHGHEHVYVTDPWYHPDHVYYHQGGPYAVYYGGYPYYYYDPRYYYNAP